MNDGVCYQSLKMIVQVAIALLVFTANAWFYDTDSISSSNTLRTVDITGGAATSIYEAFMILVLNMVIT